MGVGSLAGHTTNVSLTSRQKHKVQGGFRVPKEMKVQLDGVSSLICAVPLLLVQCCLNYYSIKSGINGINGMAIGGGPVNYRDLLGYKYM